MIGIKDRIKSQIPDHILENHPRFVDFLVSYYEWYEDEDNAHLAIRKHMERLNMNERFDLYVDAMKQEYLYDLPDEVMKIPELMIRWSKRFHASRGSRISYKFLFKVLFGNDDVTFVNPKEFIFMLSKSEYVGDENTVVLNDAGAIHSGLKMTFTSGQAIVEKYMDNGDGTLTVTFIRKTGDITLGDTVTIDGVDYIAQSDSIEVNGYYLSTQSHLSNTSKLIDSNYYNFYSFVIQTSNELDEYSQIIRDLLQPAGFKLFIE